MKGPLPREQMSMFGAAGVGIMIAAISSWLGLGALGKKQEEAQALADRMANPALAALLADPNGVARAQQEVKELQKLEKELRETDGAILETWSQATREASGEGQEWARDSGKWKDRLIAVQNRLQKESAERRVQLDPDFYLGLEAYRKKSPAPEQVPGLAIHLSVAERLVERLMEARQTSEQYPTACAFRSLWGPGSAAEMEPGAGPVAPPAQAGASPKGPERKMFRAEIRCSPEVLFAFVKLLAGDPWLFILTDLSVTNERQSFPLRSEIAKKFLGSEVAGDAALGEKKKKSLLEVLAGEESLNVVLQVDFVAWENPKPDTPSPAPTR